LPPVYFILITSPPTLHGLFFVFDWLPQLIAQIPDTGWLVVGSVVTAVVCGALTRPAMVACETPVRRWPAIMTLMGLLCGAALAFSMNELRSQQTPVVRPDALWQDLRIVHHAVCLGLLLVITATDLTSLYIPNFVVRWGLVFAVAAATLSGQLQMEHLWVDWNQQIPDLRGPYIPEWIDRHHHWHGLAWSAGGAIVGAGLTALIRKIAGWVLGRPAMGSGDVTLMAMIGAFLGWQATVMAFFIAPLLALVLGPLARRISREAAVPYGPFLALAAILVMFSWQWIWMFEVDISTFGAGADRATSFAVRRLFGDWVLLAGLGVVAIGGTAGLMGLLRLFWSIPIPREVADSVVEPTRDSLAATEEAPAVAPNDSGESASPTPEGSHP
jgi:leader peptidase (prepilin peptidase) / N-methyltransferase